MNKKQKIKLWCGLSLVFAFILWTVLLTFVDVGTIGPRESSVGFSTMNGFFHDAVGVNMTLYTITDWLGILPILFAFGFATLGLVQLIKRRQLFDVDKSILILGVFYIVVVATFVVFEKIVINYRPILIEGMLEASYPSSTTLLFTTVMPTAITEIYSRTKKSFGVGVSIVLSLITAFGVIGRILSGVHWITDIIGGIIFSVGIDLIYWSITEKFKKISKKKLTRVHSI